MQRRSRLSRPRANEISVMINTGMSILKIPKNVSYVPSKSRQLAAVHVHLPVVVVVVVFTSTIEHQVLNMNSPR